jgi:lysozyme
LPQLDIRDRLITQLTRDEGCRLKPYKDSVGKLTIGIGRNLDDVGISQDEASVLLGNDIEKASAALRTQLPWTVNLDEARFGVLVNMTFNMGITTMLKFKDTLTHIQAGQYDLAAESMLKSQWARQVGARAQRLSDQMRTGEWA